MKLPKYNSFRDAFADCIHPERGVQIYHFELEKLHGDV
jgi:hypothetical protein